MQSDLEFTSFFHSAPPEVDPGAVLRAWRALESAYDVPSRRPPIPIWARRPYSQGGEAAWAVLQRELTDASPNKDMCLYVHIPFCAEKCSFCDCYSFRLRGHFDAHTRQYVDALQREIALWSGLERLRQRPISTVHFGGGTPLFLGPGLFRRLVESIRDAFPNRQATEWALETTSSALNDSVEDLLSDLDFTRIHVGVQTLDDPLRELLQRGEDGGAVLAKIDHSIERGRVVSVDLIYGLPGQTLPSFLADIRCLAEHGVDGFSLYPLQISSRNRGMLNHYGPAGKSPLREFWMIQAAEQLLGSLGYRKTLFNHYARAKDTNLYFTFPERDEDCLALGTIADGVIGSYHYRHLAYHDYLQQVSDTFPALQGGLQRALSESRLFPLEVAILSGILKKSLFGRILGDVAACRLFEQWNRSALIQADALDADCFCLTPSGSWFAGSMMAALA